MTLYYIVNALTGTVVNVYATQEQAERLSANINLHSDAKHQTEVIQKPRRLARLFYMTNA